MKFHDTLAGRWEEKYSRRSFGRRADSLVAVAGARAHEHWLDAGCGTGTIARRLAQQGCRVTAVDGSEQMIAVARRIARAEGATGVDYLKIGDLVELPFAAASFDAVLCSSVLEYVDMPLQVLRELARVLRPGGKLVVSVPNRRALLRRLQKLAHWGTAHCGLSPWPAYLPLSRHEYTPAEFEQLLWAGGFVPRNSRYYGPGLPPSMAATRYTGTLLMSACVRSPAIAT